MVQVFPQLLLVIRVWYVTGGHLTVLVHFVHLLQIYCLVFAHPLSKDVDSFWEVFFMLEHLYTNVSNALSWLVYSVYVTIFFNVACHFIFLCFEGDV